MKKINAWLNKLLGIGKGVDVERLAGNKDSFDRTRSMEGNKEYINPNAIRTEIKKIDAWLNKLLGIGEGGDVERFIGNKDSFDRTRSMEDYKENINPNAIRAEVKKIDAWLKKFLNIGKGKDVEGLAGNKDSFDRTRSMEGNKEYINPNAIRTEIKKIDAWLNKFLGIGKGEDVERFVCTKEGYDWTGRPLSSYQTYIDANAIKEGASIIIDHNKKTIRFMMLKS
ncbi:hypothetical protein [Nitrosomonas sp. Nm34]|uniref:hypothetical protein n=1 Tax=Nitrosomonas sp. Nm34 TaxID=1881055 RepID=UPI0008E0FA44|nr:hypothetical protein [Nitrosomonas sp. Nm34]SFJ03992.1 hypothetical protein SAMN05428978_10876 [Nitrosomonas sp. Nm34]